MVDRVARSGSIVQSNLVLQSGLQSFLTKSAGCNLRISVKKVGDWPHPQSLITIEKKANFPEKLAVLARKEWEVAVSEREFPAETGRMESLAMAV